MSRDLSQDALRSRTKGLRARARAGVRWRAALRFGLLALWIGGGLALVLRVGFGVEASTAALALVPVLLAPVVGELAARRTRFTDDQAAAWIDARSGGSGFVATALERPSAAWGGRVEAQLAGLEEPGPFARPRDVAGWVPAAGFALAGLLLPVPNASADPGSAVAELVATRAEELNAKLEALEQIVELEPEEAEDFEQRLEQLAADAEELDLESAFEGLDRLEEELARAAERSAEAAERALAELQESAESAFEAPEQAAVELQEAMEELAKSGLEQQLPEQLLADLAELLENLTAGGGEAGEAGELSPSGPLNPELAAELAKRAQAYSELSKELREALAKALAQLEAQGLTAQPLSDLGELPPIDEALARALLEALQRELDKHKDCDHSPGGT